MMSHIIEGVKKQLEQRQFTVTKVCHESFLEIGQCFNEVKNMNVTCRCRQLGVTGKLTEWLRRKYVVYLHFNMQGTAPSTHLHTPLVVPPG